MQSTHLWFVMLAVAVAGEAWAQNQSLQRRQPALSKPALAPSVRPARPAAAPVRAAVPPSSTRQGNFEIQTMTSDLNNAESVRSQGDTRLGARDWQAPSAAPPSPPSTPPSTSASTPPLTPLEAVPSNQQENRSYTTTSNILKSRQDAEKNAIQNLR